MATKQQLVLEEAVAAEKAYAATLRLIVEKYCKPIKQLIESKQLSKNDAQKIVQNLEDIANFHDVFKEEIASAAAIGVGAIADVFLRYGDFLKMYTVYVNGYDRCCDTVDSLRTNAPFQDFLRQVRKDKAVGSNTLMTFLIMPVQRIPLYTLLLEKLHKESKKQGETAETINKLADAINKVKTIGALVNENKRQAEERSRLLDLQSKLTGDDNFVLITPTRQLLHQGIVQKLSLFNFKSQRRFFLFNDVLLWTTTGYGIRGYIDLAPAEVYPVNNNEVSFEILHPQSEPLVLFAASKEERDHWVSSISQACDEAAIKFRDIKHRSRLQPGLSLDLATATTLPLTPSVYKVRPHAKALSEVGMVPDEEPAIDHPSNSPPWPPSSSTINDESQSSDGDSGNSQQEVKADPPSFAKAFSQSISSSKKSGRSVKHSLTMPRKHKSKSSDFANESFDFPRNTPPPPSHPAPIIDDDLELEQPQPPPTTKPSSKPVVPKLAVDSIQLNSSPPSTASSRMKTPSEEKRKSKRRPDLTPKKLKSGAFVAAFSGELDKASDAILNLTAVHIQEIVEKFSNDIQVTQVMEAVAIALGVDSDPDNLLDQTLTLFSQPYFLRMLYSTVQKKLPITSAQLRSLKQYIKNPLLSPLIISQISVPVSLLWNWVWAFFYYQRELHKMLDKQERRRRRAQKHKHRKHAKEQGTPPPPSPSLPSSQSSSSLRKDELPVVEELKEVDLAELKPRVGRSRTQSKLPPDTARKHEKSVAKARLPRTKSAAKLGKTGRLIDIIKKSTRF